MNIKDIETKIKQYEHFVEEKLKVDLREIEKNLNIKSEKYQEWEELQQVLKVVKEFDEKDRDMKVRLEVENGVNVQGEIADFKRTYVDIGLGCLLEMEPVEADKYSEIRMKLLKKEIGHFRDLAVNVKVHIKLVLLAINELQATLLPEMLKKGAKIV